MTDLVSWVARCRREIRVSCEPVPWGALSEWRLVDGTFVHCSGRFFRVTGLRVPGAASSEPALREQPIIVQPEIGILGFLLRRERVGAPEILLQAKAEPGNVAGTQIAPSVQATESNYRRVHGGLPTPHLDFFLPGAPGRVLADSLQSEQGTRFLGKYNRNVSVDVSGIPVEPVRPEWRWLPIAQLRRALARDFLVNTDARSSLVCGDWDALADSGAAFSRWRGRGGLGEALWLSLRAGPADPGLAAIGSQLRALRHAYAFATETVPLSDLAGWKVGPQHIVDDAGSRFRVAGYRIHIANREVTDWNQPLVHSLGEGRCVLLGQRRDGLLRFLLRGSLEIGFREGVQLGPTVQSYAGDAPGPESGGVDDALLEIASSRSLSRELLACRQSDEGGRFHRSVTRYSIREVREDVDVPGDLRARWVTVGELAAMARIPGWLSNEARSVVSLLLGLA